MIAKILGTISTRLINAVLSFVAMTLNAQYLGSEKVGTISLIVFSVTIVQLFTNFFGSAALVYATPRNGVFRLLIPAYIWTIFISITASYAIFEIGFAFPELALIPSGYFTEVLLLSLAISLTSVNQMFLLGLEKIKQFNILNLVQITTLISGLLIFYFSFHFYDVMSYFWSFFISYLIAFVLSLIMLFPSIEIVSLRNIKSMISEIFRYGTMAQFANIFQMFNYRLSLKFIDTFSGRSAVGVLSVGMSLAEGFWLIGRSLAMILFSRISNEKDNQLAIKTTISFLKIVFILTLIIIFPVILLPESFFSFLFTEQFSQVKLVIITLSSGILVLSLSMILSSYFSGSNKIHHNTISSGIGLIFTVILGIFLIPEFGLAGAGITASVSYLFATAYQFIIFIKHTKVTFLDLMITKNDIKTFIAEIKQYSFKQKQLS